MSVNDIIAEKIANNADYLKDILKSKKDSILKLNKKPKARVRLHLEGGKASPAPPVGPALSQHKVKNLMQFCKDFNAATKDSPAGIKFPVDVFIFDNGEVAFDVLKMTVSDLIKQKAGISKGSDRAGRDKPVGSITCKDLVEIAEFKFNDLNALSIEAATKIIAGSARSMNVTVVE
ncbi:uL11 family ribosomal protein [Candidatus Cytomitobacter primus]|uniref:Large ribosomal subunit protein uL11 n=1 Tax=Candidatus Cytomitobacter primus TaxID=2066024 RepID=A0A5C0UF74_9PROT|nr:50S ribosomal protein L11 [Candidatus Cytomitobacter primus]QEK38367.1 50S ribosomal protein L11 [Candidatus Cytomitobacter primus]